MNLASIARAIDGKVVGDWARGPGPGHSKHDDSLAVRLDPNAPWGFWVHSHSPNYDWRAGLDHVKARLGIADEPRRDFRPHPERRTAAVEPSDQERIARSLESWHAAMAPGGTLVEIYLVSRGLKL